MHLRPSNSLVLGSILSSLVVLASVEARAAELHVDARAPDGGDGSAGSPFNSLQDALDVVAPGDIVRVGPGTYVGEHSTSTPGSEGARIEVTADEPGTAIVEADGNRALRAQHPYYTFRGLVFDGGYGERDVIAGDGGDHLELIDVEVRRSGRDCVDLGTTSDVLIERAEIHHCVANDGVGVIDGHGVTGDSVFGLTIRDSSIGLCSGDALQLSPPREPWDDVLVERTALWLGELDEDAGPIAAGTPIGENAVDTKVADGELPHLVLRDVEAWGWNNGYIANQAAFNIKESVDCVIDRVTVHDSEQAFRLRAPATVRVDNAVVHSVDVGFRLEDGISGATLLHVTIGADVGAVITDAGGAPEGLTIENLLVLGGALPAEAPGGSNLAVDDAAFVDAGGHDYHLVMGGAPVDAGVTLAEVVVDRDGVPRPTGPSSDVGAYEWTDEPPGDGDGDGDSGDGDGDSGDGDGDGDPGDGGESGDDGSGDAGETGDSSSEDGPAGDFGGACGCRTRPQRGPMLPALALLVLGCLRRRSRSGQGRRHSV